MVAGDSRVHCIRRQIDLSRPRNRAAINEDVLEELHVTQGCEDTGQFFWTQAHSPSQSVLESNKKAVAGFRFHFHYIPVHSNRAPIIVTAQPFSAVSSPGRAASLPTIPLDISSPSFLDQVQSRSEEHTSELQSPMY